MTFLLDEAQWGKISDWRKRHSEECCLQQNGGAIGGALTYSFTPTSLFVVTEVTCACGAKIDVTDYQDV